MKNWKKFILIAFIGLFGIACTFVACDNRNGTNTEIDIDGSKTEKTGYTIPGMTTSIVVIKEIGVTDVQMTNVLDNISQIYQQNGWITICKTGFEDGRITQIRIVSGNGLIKDGTILKIGYQNIKDDIDNFMGDVAVGKFPYQLPIGGVQIYSIGMQDEQKLSEIYNMLDDFLYNDVFDLSEKAKFESIIEIQIKSGNNIDFTAQILTIGIDKSVGEIASFIMTNVVNP